jgi:hypothetical protein
MKRELDSSFQCWIIDGSWPAAHADQTECANRLKVRYSKDRVLSVKVKRCQKTSGAYKEAELIESLI